MNAAVPVVIGQMSLFIPILLLQEIMDLEYKAACSECWKNKDRADVSENVVNCHFIRSQGQVKGVRAMGTQFICSSTIDENLYN